MKRGLHRVNEMSSVERYCHCSKQILLTTLATPATLRPVNSEPSIAALYYASSKPSRQLLWQRKQNEAGLCSNGCGREVAVGPDGVRRTQCVACMTRSRTRSRERMGFKAWREGLRGRPPIWKRGGK